VVTPKKEYNSNIHYGNLSERISIWHHQIAHQEFINVLNVEMKKLMLRENHLHHALSVVVIVAGN